MMCYKFFKQASLAFSIIIIVFLIEFSSSSRLNIQSIRSINTNPYNVLFPNSTYTNLHEFDYSHGDCRNNNNCFLPYGICLNSTTCMCMPDYAHVYIEGHSIQEMNCSYKRRKVVVAALLELFLPLGLGHFYVGHYTLGTFKFFYNFFLYFFCFFLYYKGTNNEVLSNMIILCVVLSCIIPLWNIIDLFLFFSGVYKDGYGIPLE